MERRIKNKIDKFQSEFKEELRDHLTNQIQNINADNPEEYADQLKKLKMKQIQFIYNYQPLHLSDEDFKKRKRIKNNIPLEDRCCAYKANKQQCSRRKLDVNPFCGTHLKGQPHGIINEVKHEQNTTITVWNEDIGGILYYIDIDGKVYDPNDILSNKTNPKIIATYTKTVNEFGNFIYNIPEFNI